MVTLFLALLSVPLSTAAPADGASAEAPATLRWQVDDLRMIKQVAPSLPAVGAVPEAVVCATGVTVASSGEPATIEVGGCPDAYVQATRDAVDQWRWAPMGPGAERRLEMNVRFPAATVRAPAAAAAPSEADTASLGTSRRHVAAPRTAGSTAQAPAPDQHVVCAAEVRRNRRGRAMGVDVVSCPASFRDALEDAVTQLAAAPAAPVDRSAPAVRKQRVTLTFAVEGI